MMSACKSLPVHVTEPQRPLMQQEGEEAKNFGDHGLLAEHSRAQYLAAFVRMHSCQDLVTR